MFITENKHKWSITTLKAASPVIYGLRSWSIYVSKCFTSLIRHTWEPQQGQVSMTQVTSSKAGEVELSSEGHQAGLGLSVECRSQEKSVGLLSEGQSQSTAATLSPSFRDPGWTSPPSPEGRLAGWQLQGHTQGYAFVPIPGQE